MPSSRRNSFNLGLPATPEISERQQFQEFVRVYNAINILADFLDSYTNSGGVASGSFTNVTIAQLLDISAATAGQIKFPAAQNPSANVNTLDDYEEGTFTPTISFGGASVGVTYSIQNGTYTKIGNRVIFDIFIALSSKGSSVGTVLIGGLPFALTGGAYNSPVDLRTSAVTVTAGGERQAFAMSASTTIQFEQVSAAGVAAQLDNTNVSNTSSFILSGQYKV
jgi:hypothetical protein